MFSSSLSRVGLVFRRRGVGGILLALWRRVSFYSYTLPKNAILFLLQKNKYSVISSEFTFLGEKFPYLRIFKNFVFDTERTVEVPLGIFYMQKALSYHKRVLEIGNVLHNYWPIPHDVLDKYEKGERVISCDAEEFIPSLKYDFILSISTVEHIGWNFPDTPDPEKIPRTLANIAAMLAPGGRAVITMPLGYNPEMDARLFSGYLPFSKKYFLKRISPLNEWKEVAEAEVRGARYGKPFPAANGLLVGFIERGN